MTAPPGDRRTGLYRDWLKRPVDLGVLALTLPFWGPLLLGSMAAVALSMGRPVFFRQQRIGKDEQPFRILKLRTMTEARGPDGQLLPDGERITPTGRFLRRTSLDELPEILNIVKGDMAIVGPRPLLPEYLPLYSPGQRRRHRVRPGLTGLAQISGRNALTWPEKFAFDTDYVERVSLGLDLRLMLATFAALIGRQGISAPGHETMPPFRGETGEDPLPPVPGPPGADNPAGNPAETPTPPTRDTP